ncbi:MAG TPA: MBL fold metallo-hydrolase [Pyrinomonadaceae bacterium]|nr:MBL fold metallo-hydrolase [Pyrinomonadaceae bacterium]
MKMVGSVSLLIVLLLTSLCSPSEVSQSVEGKQEIKKSGVTATYIGNEGVLLSAGDKQVLIDGLHREYKPDYAFPPPALLSSLESATAPYDRIRLILVTHLHLDHFHPVSVGRHLKNNPRAELVSSEQIAEGMKKDFEGFAGIESRVKRFPHQWKTKASLNVSGISLTYLGLRHASPQFKWIQNLGYIVELNGKKFLHVGDAELSVENFASLNLRDEKIDVAFLPYWFLLSPADRKIVESQIGPREVVAVHVSPADAANVAAQVEAAYPKAHTFTRILEVKDF